MNKSCQFFQGFATGGKDGVVVLWDENFTQPLRAFQIETSKFPPGTILLHEHPPVRSIHTDEGRVLVGTGHDDIIEIHADGSMEVILQVCFAFSVGKFFIMLTTGESSPSGKRLFTVIAN